MIKVPLALLPTAQARRAERAATPKSWPSLALGPATRCHPVPFQRAIRGSRPLVAPTAQAFLADVAATALRVPLNAAAARWPAGRAARPAVAADTGACPASAPATSSSPAGQAASRVASRIILMPRNLAVRTPVS